MYVILMYVCNSNVCNSNVFYLIFQNVSRGAGADYLSASSHMTRGVSKHIVLQSPARRSTGVCECGER